MGYMGYNTYSVRKAVRTALSALVVVILACGCGSRGEGLTINRDGLHVGTSLSKRDQIAQDKSNAELAQLRARTEIEQEAAAASIERAEAMGAVTRPVVFTLGLALALGVAAAGLGYGAQRAAPALGMALEVRKARQFQIALDVSSDGCHASFKALGYDPKEIAEIVRASPALDAPRLAELQTRVGDRGVKALLANGELETALARLPTLRNERGDVV